MQITSFFVVKVIELILNYFYVACSFKEIGKSCMPPIFTSHKKIAILILHNANVPPICPHTFFVVLNLKGGPS